MNEKSWSGGTRHNSELENRHPIFYSINVFVSQIKLNEKLIILGPFYERTALLLVDGWLCVQKIANVN